MRCCSMHICVLSCCLPDVTTCLGVFFLFCLVDSELLLRSFSTCHAPLEPLRLQWSNFTSCKRPPPCSLTPHKWLPPWNVASPETACSDIMPTAAPLLLLTHTRAWLQVVLLPTLLSRSFPWGLNHYLSFLSRREGSPLLCQRSPWRATLPWLGTARWRALSASAWRLANGCWLPNVQRRFGRALPRRAQTVSRSISPRLRPDYETLKRIRSCPKQCSIHAIALNGNAWVLT